MKKKILIFSYKLPYPLTQGGAIAQFFFLEKLIKLYEVTFCTVVSNENQKKNLELLQLKLPTLNVDFYEVEAEKKTWRWILNKFFLRLKARFKIKNKVSQTNKRKNNLGELLDEKLFSFLNELIKKGSFELVQFDFYETLVTVPVIPDHIKKVFVHHEVRSKRDKMLNKRNDQFQDYLVNSTEIFEKAFLEKSDAVIVFNQEDQNYLKDIKTSIYISPFGVPEELIQKKEASKKFEKFIFIGGEFHFPNKEGLEWFLDMIFIPNYNNIEWSIHVIGYWSKGTIEKYSSYAKIIFCGYVSDLNQFYEDAVMIVPVLSGSGLRTKILMALANKVPVFSTEFASEGLLFDNKTDNYISIFNNESEFLEIVTKSTNDKSLISLANKGFDFYKKNFNSDDLVSTRLQILEAVLKDF